MSTTWREQNKLHGYRDGADWKFKADDVQNYLAEQIKSKHARHSGDEDEELVLGGTQSTASGGSDLELSDSRWLAATSTWEAKRPSRKRLRPGA